MCLVQTNTGRKKKDKVHITFLLSILQKYLQAKRINKKFDYRNKASYWQPSINIIKLQTKKIWNKNYDEARFSEKKGFFGRILCGGFLLNVYKNSKSWRSLYRILCTWRGVVTGKRLFLVVCVSIVGFVLVSPRKQNQAQVFHSGRMKDLGWLHENKTVLNPGSTPGYESLQADTSGLIKKKPNKGEGISHRPKLEEAQRLLPQESTRREYIRVFIVLGHHRFGATAWNCWAHRLSRNLEPEQLGWHCGIHFMWNLLQTLPFRTIIAFLRTIMYYVLCIIYSGGYWFIKELWANCQVIIWTVVMSNNKGYNLHSYTLFLS